MEVKADQLAIHKKTPARNERGKGRFATIATFAIVTLAAGPVSRKKRATITASPLNNTQT
jgi:hypothetical protein